MMLSIDLNSIKNGVVSGYHVVAAKTSEWMGRAIAILKSGSETALPYLQDKRLAAISLIAVNLILIEVGDVLGRLLAKCLPHRTRGQKAFGEVVAITFGLATLGGGVIAFVKYAKLPFNALAITGISVGTIFVRALFARDSDRETELD